MKKVVITILLLCLSVSLFAKWDSHIRKNEDYDELSKSYVSTVSVAKFTDKAKRIEKNVEIKISIRLDPNGFPVISFSPKESIFERISKEKKRMNLEVYGDYSGYNFFYIEDGVLHGKENSLIFIDIMMADKSIECVLEVDDITYYEFILSTEGVLDALYKFPANLSTEYDCWNVSYRDESSTRLSFMTRYMGTHYSNKNYRFNEHAYFLECKMYGLEKPWSTNIMLDRDYKNDMLEMKFSYLGRGEQINSIELRIPTLDYDNFFLPSYLYESDFIFSIKMKYLEELELKQMLRKSDSIEIVLYFKNRDFGEIYTLNSNELLEAIEYLN